MDGSKRGIASERSIAVGQEPHVAAALPSEPQQHVLLRLRKQVPPRTPVQPGGNYFGLGGNTRKALQIIAPIEDRIGRRIPLILLKPGFRTSHRGFHAGTAMCRSGLKQEAFSRKKASSTQGRSMDDGPSDDTSGDTALPRHPLVRRSADQISVTQLTAFIRFCEERGACRYPGHHDFERFCIERSGEFWQLFLEWSQLACEGSASPAITSESCEFARFFPELRLNYVENLLRIDDDTCAASQPALTAVHGNRPSECWSRAELRERVNALATALAELGLGPGSHVAIVARNTPGAIFGCLAAAAIGCTVSTGAPEMGTFALTGRLGQTEPVLLMADLPDSAAAAGKQQRERLVEIVQGLPTLRGVLLFDDWPAPEGLHLPVHHASEWLARYAGRAVSWPRLPFNHPLFVLFTSGTTGVPKCLVHGAGGTLIEHLKEHRLHCDFGSSDKLFFHTATGWMMWNWQLSALASGTEVVVYDGLLTGPDTLWRIVSDEQVTVFGTSPTYLGLCEASGWAAGADFDFGALRAILSTGSILYPRQQEWVWNHVKPLPIQSISGGTDIVGCFVLGNPNLPVYSAECQCRSLGLDVRALVDQGAPQPQAIGELVCANPFPSRPLGFLNDPGGSRFHAAYFADNPGFWTHGDRIEFTPEGSARIHGRSDGVLNVRGVRIGPAEIYRILESVPEVTEAMAVEQYAEDEPGGVRLVLLLVLRRGVTLDDALVARIRRELGRRGSPEHVPALMIAVDQLPTTYSGKRSERSARDALNGRPVINAGALQNPECLEALKAYAVGARAAPATSPNDAGLEPGAPLRQVMTRIWEDVLSLSPIAADDNYFDLGGNSLKALQIIARLSAQTRHKISLTLLLEAPTVASLTAAIEQAQPFTYRPLILLRPGTGTPPLFIVHGLGGSAMELKGLSQEVETDRPIYAIQARGFEPGDTPHERIEDMACEYLAAVRGLQPNGPYWLAGYSFGGLVAYEMARRLTDAGEEIALLALFDTTVPERHWPPAAWIEYFLRRLRRGFRDMQGLKPRERAQLWLRLSHSLQGRIGRARLTPEEARDEAEGVAQLPEVVRRIRLAALAASLAYRPQPGDLAVSLFRSDTEASPYCDPEAVWRRVARKLEIYDVPGDHWTMIRPPHLPVLAKQLSRCLRMLGRPSHGAQASSDDLNPIGVS